MTAILLFDDVEVLDFAGPFEVFSVAAEVLVQWLREAHEGAELVLSVCSGVRLLARAGLLDGLRVTTHHQVVEHLRELAPAAIVEPDRRYVDAGKIVTTGGISAGIDGAFCVVARLWGRDVARATADYMDYDWAGS